MQPFKSTNYFEFSEKFASNDDCYRYLSDLKWGKGFSCKRCQCTESVRSKKWYYRRCKKCLYDESATSGTLFHKLKFPLIKAFHILFRISINKKGISSVQIAKEFGIQQKTAWLFRQKAQISMKSSGNTFLSGKVNVDEFTVGGPEKGLPGRSDSSKNIVMIAIEVRGRKKKKKIGLAYAQCIEDYSSDSFRSFFENRIDKKAIVQTDGFRSYIPLADTYNIRQFYSENGKGFPEIHLIIMNFKSWLRGVHHKCQYRYMQRYLDEFIFRFNRRYSEKSMFNKIIERFIGETPWPLKRIYELNG
jgi:transposase-like protein